MPAKSNESVTSFTANASQSNESVTCAHVADTEVCGWHGEENSFLLPWKLIFTTVEKKIFFHPVEIFFYPFNKFE